MFKRRQPKKEKPAKRQPFTEPLSLREEELVKQKAHEIWLNRPQGTGTAEDDWKDAIACLQQEAEQLQRESAQLEKNQRSWGYKVGKLWSRLGLEGKTLWDWLQVLGVPITLALIGFFFQEYSKQRDQVQQEASRQQEQQLADDRFRQDTLVKYLAEMSDLLEKGLLRSPSRSEMIIIAQAKTVNALQSLDPKRQFLVFQFLEAANLNTLNQYGLLHQARMAKTDFTGADLGGVVMIGADLSYADFSCRFPDAVYPDDQCADLSEANLNSSDLRFAKLVSTNLHSTNFTNADLTRANLEGAILTRANLSNAILEGADLSNAHLSGAILSGAVLLGAHLGDSQDPTLAQLLSSPSPFLCATRLPPEIRHISDRDCDRIPQLLVNRYPEWYKTLEAAQQYVKFSRERGVW